MRRFEKISMDEYLKTVSNGYDDIMLPKRGTKHSAGYDISSAVTYNLKVGESYMFPTGIKCALNDDEVLLIIIRSSLGFKYNIRLVNQVGVVDADYYNNPSNEGHIFIKLKNEGDKDILINKGDRIAQGIITKYLCVDNEDVNENERKGGIGSTGE